MDSLKVKAIKLRKAGYSYSMIKNKTGISKSTLSNWLATIPFIPNEEVLKKIGKAKLKSSLFKQNQKMAEVVEMRAIAAKELGQLTKRDLWLLGIGLYLGEGTKSFELVRIVNSDPQIIKIAMKWFREMCGLVDENFNPFVHAYPDNDIREAMNYWSKVTGVPIKQFGRTQIDTRNNKVATKRKSLPYGTLHLHIRSCGKKEFGRRLHRRIMGWIDSATKQI